MRVAITGTHGVGKTTLARALSERLVVPMIEEVARDVIRRYGFNTTSEYIAKANIGLKRIIQTDIFGDQRLKECHFTRFVSDRSVFDVVAYSEVYGVDKERVNKLLGDAVGHALNSYDLIVYVPPFWEPKADGFRDLEERLWLDVDLTIQKYINAFSLLGGNVLRIEAEELDDRMNEVMSAVKRLEARHEAV